MNRKTRSLLGLVAAVTLGLVLVAPGQAAMIVGDMVNVQFYGRGNGNPAAAQQHTQGAAVSLDTTPYWNQFSVTGLYNWGGVGPGQTLNLDNDNSGLVASGITFYQSSTEHNAIQLTALPIFKGCIYGVGAQTTTMEFSGLTTGQPYDLYAYGAGAGGGAVKYTLTYGPSDSVAVKTTTDGSYGSYATPDNYVLFANVLPRSTGKLTLVGSSPAGGYFGINGLQLVLTPEPATMALLGLGGLGLILGRKRK